MYLYTHIHIHMTLSRATSHELYEFYFTSGSPWPDDFAFRISALIWVMIYLHPTFGRSCVLIFFPHSPGNLPAAQPFFYFLSFFFWKGKRPQEEVTEYRVYFSGLLSRFWCAISYCFIYLWRIFCWFQRDWSDQPLP